MYYCKIHAKNKAYLIPSKDMKYSKLKYKKVSELKAICNERNYSVQKKPKFAELFTVTGFWSPIILAVIGVLGILAGIALRIRHFLYLGTVFLLLDILIQIFEAGKRNTWIWWFSGISLGTATLILFAWFER